MLPRIPERLRAASPFSGRSAHFSRVFARRVRLFLHRAVEDAPVHAELVAAALVQGEQEVIAPGTAARAGSVAQIRRRVLHIAERACSAELHVRQEWHVLRIRLA